MNFKEQVTQFCEAMAANVKAQKIVNENMLATLKHLQEQVEIAQERITILNARQAEYERPGYYGPG